MTAVMTLSGETPVGSGLDSDVALAAGGDQSAFERLYRTHVSRIHSLTRRMLSTQEADEVTQDIFVRTWQKLGQFRGESAFSTWLHRLAVNVVIERRRSFAIQRDRMTDDPSALDLLTVGPARADLKVDFESAIARLPPGAREKSSCCTTSRVTSTGRSRRCSTSRPARRNGSCIGPAC